MRLPTSGQHVGGGSDPARGLTRLQERQAVESDDRPRRREPLSPHRVLRWARGYALPGWPLPSRTSCSFCLLCAFLMHIACYDGQDITIPDNYPFQPVKMKFITKVYHPNISSASGAICLDILKDAWSPVLTLKSTLISLQSLLCSPEPRDPQDAEVAKHYMTSKSSFEDTARYWTMIYAGGPGKDGLKGGAKDGLRDEIAMAGLDRAHVAQFEGLGFDRAKVVSNVHPSLCAISSEGSQIDVLRRLNYRGANVANINDDRVVEELLK